ncbi:MAG: hypothetical protein U0168_27310 [Nannocystaceae bacterium]
MAEFHSPLIELTLARLREFIRDPGAVFWTFGFPIVLAVALGIAFRESPPPQAPSRSHEAARMRTRSRPRWRPTTASPRRCSTTTRPAARSRPARSTCW